MNNKKEKARHRIPFRLKVYFKESASVKIGDVLAEWDPFTLPIIAQIDGFVAFKDLEEGITTREIIDESTGLSSNIVMDWKQQAKNQNLVPRLELHDKKIKVMYLSLRMESASI